MNDVVVRTARPEDRDRLVTTLTAAFATDAVTSWLLGPRRARRRHLLRFFTTLVSPSVVADGGCDLTSGGAAVWYRPGAYEATAGVSPLELVRLAAGFGARLPTVARADAAMRAHHPSEPHWYLQFVGVEPAGPAVGPAPGCSPTVSSRSTRPVRPPTWRAAAPATCRCTNGTVSWSPTRSGSRPTHRRSG